MAQKTGREGQLKASANLKTDREKSKLAWSEQISLVGTHERTFEDLVTEGFDLPVNGTVVAYFDVACEREVFVLAPNREIAAALATAHAQKRIPKQKSRKMPRFLSFSEALR